jgi:hypothetical protein
VPNGGRKAPSYAASLAPDVTHSDHVAKLPLRGDGYRKLPISSKATANTLGNDYDSYRSSYNHQTTIKNNRNWIQSHRCPIVHSTFKPADNTLDVLEYSATSSLQQNLPIPLEHTGLEKHLVDMHAGLSNRLFALENKIDKKMGIPDSHIVRMEALLHTYAHLKEEDKDKIAKLETKVAMLEDGKIQSTSKWKA